MQFYGGEDPATGSAAGCAISYLVCHGIVAPRSKSTFSKASRSAAQAIYFWLPVSDFGQGDAMLRVAGSTVRVAKGQLFLP